MTLAEFLTDRLDEDEAAAKACGQDSADWLSEGKGLRWGAGGAAASFAFADDARHAARHDPARVLREVAAKRGVLDVATVAVGSQWPDLRDLMLRHMAAVYSDHPDYQPEWKP